MRTLRCRRRFTHTLLMLAISMFTPLVAHAGATTRPVVSDGFHPDIEYGKADEASLRLDAFVPPGEGPRPVVIVVHGGGWGAGNKRRDMAPIFPPLSEAKFTWFSIDYRLAPTYRWPACYEDELTAIRWVKAHAAEYKGDPDRIALVGESAGGQLACLAGMRDDEATRVRAVVGFAPPTDLEADTARRGGLSKSLQALFGKQAVDDEARRWMREMSALDHARAGMPPFLLIHGNADKSVPYEQSLTFRAKLKELGVPCDLITIDGGPHGMTRWEKLDTSYKQKMIDWLQRTLGEGK